MFWLLNWFICRTDCADWSFKELGYFWKKYRGFPKLLIWWRPQGYKLLLVLTENLYSYTKFHRYLFPPWCGGLWQVEIVLWSLNCDTWTCHSTSIIIFASQSLRLFCPVYLEQCVFEVGCLISHNFLICPKIWNVELSYCRKSKVCFVTQHFHGSVCSLAGPRRIRAVIVTELLMQFKNTVLNKYFREDKFTI